MFNYYLLYFCTQGRTYFFHAATNTSSWIAPMPQQGSENSTMPQQGLAISTQQPQANANPTLPPGWTQNIGDQV